MDSTDIDKYAEIMKEIKVQKAVIDSFLSGQREAIYIPTTVETIGLQFRKVFELIAFATLAANRDQYSLAYTDFAKHWKAAKLLKNLQRINPDFYPKPVLEVQSDRPDILHDLKERDQDYLTQDDLITAPTDFSRRRVIQNRVPANGGLGAKEFWACPPRRPWGRTFGTNLENAPSHAYQCLFFNDL